MSYLVVVVLSLLWLGFFLPGLLQSRRTSSPLASAATFQESLTRISTGRAVTPEQAAEAARRRRKTRREIARQRDILAVLSANFIATLVLAITFTGPIRWLVAPAALAFVGYVVALRLQAVDAAAPMPRSASDPVVVPSVRRRDPAASTPAITRDEAELQRLAG